MLAVAARAADAAPQRPSSLLELVGGNEDLIRYILGKLDSVRAYASARAVERALRRLSPPTYIEMLKACSAQTLMVIMDLEGGIVVQPPGGQTVIASLCMFRLMHCLRESPPSNDDATNILLMLLLQLRIVDEGLGGQMASVPMDEAYEPFKISIDNWRHAAAAYAACARDVIEKCLHAAVSLCDRPPGDSDTCDKIREQCARLLLTDAVRAGLAFRGNVRIQYWMCRLVEEICKPSLQPSEEENKNRPPETELTTRSAQQSEVAAESRRNECAERNVLDWLIGTQEDLGLFCGLMHHPPDPSVDEIFMLQMCESITYLLDGAGENAFGRRAYASMMRLHRGAIIGIDRFSSDPAVQAKAIGVLCQCFGNPRDSKQRADAAEAAYQSGAVPVLIQALKTHPHHVHVVQNAAVTLFEVMFPFADHAAEAIRRDGVAALADVLKIHNPDTTSAGNAARDTLACLCHFGGNPAKRLALENGIPAQWLA